MIDKRICDKGFIWNPSNCQCECEKLCDAGEYLDYANWKGRKMLVHKLDEDCSENIDEKELHTMELISVTSSDYKNVCGSFAIYIALLAIFFIINMSVSCAFVYFYWFSKKSIHEPFERTFY